MSGLSWKIRLGGWLLAFALSPTLAAADQRAETLVAAENRKQGTTDWQLTRVRPDRNGFRTPWIEGYCSKQSVRSGESIDIMVSANPPQRFHIEIFRMGFYGGRGARLMTKLGPFDGAPQPDPEIGAKNVHECQWQPTTSLTIPSDWLSGVYLGRLTTLPVSEDTPYWQSYVVFIVRDDRPADILFQCSDNTWQAYNRWPNHYSLYTHPNGTQGPWADVSFERPYGREAQHIGVVNDPLTFGSGEFLPFEFPLAFWLEQHGYDVTYCSNSDLLTPERGLKCKAFISVGHDEYWDIRQFRSVEQMRDAGVSLLFLSGNSVCWVAPLRPSGNGRPHRIFSRAGPYGANNDYALERERNFGPFSERGPDEGLLMGARNVEPVNGGGDWIIERPDHWIFAGADVKRGDRIPGLVGWEYHGAPADIAGLEVVAAGTAFVGGERPQRWTATVYPGPKDNFVFNAATIFWAQGLSSPPGHTLPWSHWSRPHGPDARVQQITQNLLQRALKQSAKQNGLIEPSNVRKVVSDGRHNAFAAFVKWKGHYWLAFRKATGHVARDGDMIVLRSADTHKWTEILRMDISGDDRDAQFLVTADKLFLYTNSLFEERRFDVSVTHTGDGQAWSTPQTILEPGFILWKPIQHAGRYWAGAHRPGPNTARSSHLVTSSDGIDWHRISTIRSGQGESETTLLFEPSGQLTAFLRCQATVGGAILVSEPPYAKWQERPAEVHLSGHAAYTFDGVIYVISRLLAYDPPLDPAAARPPSSTGTVNVKQATMVYTYENGRLHPYCQLGALDGNHDSSYAAAVRDGDDLLIVYHRAAHEYEGEFRSKDAADIYLARVPLKLTQ